jgi:preprotein translocase subunit SecD
MNLTFLRNAWRDVRGCAAIGLGVMMMTACGGSSGTSTDGPASSVSSVSSVSSAVEINFTIVHCGPLAAADDAAQFLLRQRLDAFDNVEIEYSGGEAAIRLPGALTADDAAAICATPEFEVRPVLALEPALADSSTSAVATPGGDVQTSADGTRYFLGPALATAAAFEANAAAELVSGSWLVMVSLTDDGGAAFNSAAEVCFAHDGLCPTGQLALVLDGQVLAAPSVATPEFAGEIQIAGAFDEPGATTIAAAINAAVNGFGVLSIEHG